MGEGVRGRERGGDAKVPHTVVMAKSQTHRGWAAAARSTNNKDKNKGSAPWTSGIIGLGKWVSRWQRRCEDGHKLRSVDQRRRSFTSLCSRAGATADIARPSRQVETVMARPAVALQASLAGRDGPNGVIEGRR